MPEVSLECYTRRDGRRLVHALEGTLDVATAPRAGEWLQRAMLEHGPDLVIDASRIHFVDSKGIGALLLAAKSARELGGRLYLLDPALPVCKILEMCGLTALFPPPARLEPEAAPRRPAEAGPSPAPRAGSAAARPLRKAA